MVLYDHDSNVIIPEPIKLQSESKLIRAYDILYSKLTYRGLRPNFQMLDNACPAVLNSCMRHEGLTFQLVPPTCTEPNLTSAPFRTLKII